MAKAANITADCSAGSFLDMEFSFVWLKLLCSGVVRGSARRHAEQDMPNKVKPMITALRVPEGVRPKGVEPRAASIAPVESGVKMQDFATGSGHAKKNGAGMNRRPRGSRECGRARIKSEKSICSPRWG
jgi:hypothetical protein